MGKLGSTDKSFKIRFRYPQAPKEQRPPKGEGAAIPDRLMDDMIILASTVDRCVYLWMAAKTYGQHRRQNDLSYSEISIGNKISLIRAVKAVEKIRKSELAEITF